MFKNVDSLTSDPTERTLLRRQRLGDTCPNSGLSNIPVQGLDYDKVSGRCCENVIGFIPIPLGLAGPLLVDSIPSHIPLATTEGCLVASVHRGCKALTLSNGTTTRVLRSGIKRGHNNISTSFSIF
ncbi:hypothetical protein P9112_013603 [Eukaryota sp. TZLM1-RC]